MKIVNKIKSAMAVAAAALLTAAPANAQNDNVTVFVPNFDVRMSMGFNYDLLRSLTDVSFDRPMGYLGLNVPFFHGGNLTDFMSESAIDDLFNDSDFFERGDNFKPTARAQQNDNYTIRVDVPMLHGVGSFAYTQNFFMNLSTALGGAEVINMWQDVGDASPNVDGYVAIKGALRLPLNISLGWETMTFGYTYRIANNDDFRVALNLHRHLFSMNVQLAANIDLLGHADVQTTIPVAGAPDLSFEFNDELINFNSGDCNGQMSGRYRAEVWSPSFGARFGRFTLDSRLGFKVKARGSARGRFVMPKIVDLETGEIAVLDELDDLLADLDDNPAFIFDMIPRDTDSIIYEIGETMHWEMPSGHTIGFDIIPNRMNISYTKLFGDVNLRITDINRVRYDMSGNGETPEEDKQRLDAGVKIDHILMFSMNYPSFFFNLGIAGIDFWSRDKDGNVSYALRDVDGLESLRIGDVVMIMPIFSGGVELGTNDLRLRLEADVLPLPAIRTGVRYHF